MEDVKSVIEKIKKEMKKDKEMLFNSKGVESIDKEIRMEFIREKYIGILTKDKKINDSIVENFVDNLLKEIA